MNSRAVHLVLDLAEGETLATRLAREGPLTLRPAVEWALRLACIAEEMHARGLVHTDLRAATVVCMPTGVAVMPPTNRRGLSSVAATRTGDSVGGSWAPEVVSGAEVDARTDVYGLGTILFAMLCGSSPYPDHFTAIQLLAAQREPPPPPSMFNPGVDQRLNELCARCLSLDPAERFPSADALAVALTRFFWQNFAKPSGTRRWLDTIRALVGKAGDSLAARGRTE